MKLFRNIAITFLVLVIIAIGSVCYIYNTNIKPVDENDNSIIEVLIPSGTSKRKVGEILEEKELIRSSTFFNIYVKLFEVGDFKASVYGLSKSMDLKEIISILEEGNSYNPNQIKITFKEGINIREVATLIKDNTNNSYDDVISLINNKDYLNELKEKYWFIKEDVNNEKLYYSLEGYLFPDTYYFNNKDVSIKEILTKMLDRMEDVLDEYVVDIKASNYSVHEILTLASIIEKEGKTRDFYDISSVFHNRLKVNMSLSSCATAFYGMGMDFNEVGIANSEMLANVNAYNTYKLTSLPVGPIALPSKNAIDAAINPKDTENLYFLSDNQGNTYFFKTYAEHQKKERELRAQGKWER
ncbi:MAG: endolytic transglycosylase MltG [Bacilli bacterium]|nr:endolytic transglycosylase MltG [Bacilli bacterium]